LELAVATVTYNGLLHAGIHCCHQLSKPVKTQVEKVYVVVVDGLVGGVAFL